MIASLLEDPDDQYLAKTQGFLKDFASSGLRTLLLAQRELKPEFYEEWSERYYDASCLISGREEALDKLALEIEHSFSLIGSTAIEDKLQDEVDETIKILRDAGIKIWVLTGDKIETAINIGFSCKVLDNQMNRHLIDERGSSQIMRQIDQAIDSYKSAKDEQHAIIVAGDSLLKITN